MQSDERQTNTPGGAPAAPRSLFEGTYAQRQRATIACVREQVIGRSRRESRSVEVYTKAKAGAELDRDQALRKTEGEFSQSKVKLEKERRKLEEEAQGKYNEALAEINRKHHVEMGRAKEQYERLTAKAKKQRQEELLWAEAAYDGSKSKPRQAFENLQREVEGRLRGVDQIVAQGLEAVSPSARKAAAGMQPSAGAFAPGSGGSPRGDVDAATVALQKHVGSIKGGLLFTLGRMHLELALPILLGVVGAAVGFLVPAAQQALGLDASVAAGAFGGAGAVLGALVGVGVMLASGSASKRALQQMIDAAGGVRMGCERWLAQAADERARMDEEIKNKRVSDREKAEEVFRATTEKIEAREGKAFREAEAIVKSEMASHESRLKERMAEVERRFATAMAEAERRHAEGLAGARAQFESRMRDAHEARDAEKQSIERDWFGRLGDATRSAEQMGQESLWFARAWSDGWWKKWKAPLQTAPAIQVGEMRVNADAFRDAEGHGGLPGEAELLEGLAPDMVSPTVLDFPGRHGSLLIECPSEARERGIRTMQHVMLRLLTCIPPGKLRFTIFDPVGLGQSFAGFMHLADYEELLVTNRIWTEERHIEARLSELTEHMENVIQKYLRNEFKSIEDYNEHAGEIAEPYRFVIVTDFPTGFTEQSCRRLKNIVESGPRCGVYTIVLADPKRKPPGSIEYKDLRSSGLVVRHKSVAVGAANASGASGGASGGVAVAPNDAGAFDLVDPELAELPLRLVSPPGDDEFRALVHSAGDQSRNANRVEVPFRLLSPREDIWVGDTGREIVVPVGRAGATRFQELRLGVGVSQHVIIGGKTGSGKSTLLHVIVTNACQWFGPDQVQFYLIDFKKGVEFKAYATETLPHIRAVAIESEREFGLSVLARLDEELTRRGDMFRDVGAQNVAGWRERRPDVPMPRIMLIVDEFQEFFIEDDKIAQDSQLLLDRLVRQGRAFGIHVILGSQTLGGAYSVSRSTLGQMGVRIALQCNEADSYLILSEDNAAARLLTRPGEAIYNDQNGMVEGNSPFQVAWLSDAQRDDALRRVEQKARELNVRIDEPQIVFEGNVAADLSRNHQLRKSLETGLPGRVPMAWIGEPVAIKDPTACEFRRQTSNNMVVVGQRDDLALAMTMCSIVSVAVQHKNVEGARLVVLDGVPDDDAYRGKLGALKDLLPGRIEVGNWRTGPALLGPVAAELDRREAENTTEGPPIFVFIHGLQKFRELRKKDEDFGFSFSGTGGEEGEPKVSPDKHLARILKDGSGYGIHVVCWVDTYTNLNRVLDRSSQGEFEVRVAFQMSAADSSALIDSAVAAKLGPQRAIYFNEDQGVTEKFRPYGIPSDEFLASVRERLSGASGRS